MCMREGSVLVMSSRSRAAGSDLSLCDPDIFGDVLAGRGDRSVSVVFLNRVEPIIII
jgi:hypothetical protein